MANVYKMTLYVCDPEEKFAINEIEAFIDEGLEREDICCIPHFDNEEVGPSFEWYEGHDLDKFDSTTEQWEKYLRGNFEK